MAKLFGREYSKQELLRHVGRMDQVGGVRKVILDEGNEKGNEAIQFNTGSGLKFTALAGRALDITSADYCGQSLCWRSPCGDVEASYYDPDGLGWLKTFYGGLVATCGLSWAGAPHLDPDSEEGCPMYYQDDDGKLQWQPTGSMGLHGRISTVPAKHLSLSEWWDGDEYWMSVSGQMRETAVFGPNLVLKRTIRAKLGEPTIWIDDVVENQGHDPAEHMFLYHCNFGFPILSKGAEYFVNARSTQARDEDAAPHIDTWAQFPEPTPDQVEWVYYHDLATGEDDRTAVGIANRDFNDGEGFGGYLRFSKKQLPNLIQWKMPAEGTYVTGLEPANCLVEGRTKDRDDGRLVTLDPGECAEYNLEVGVLRDNEEIEALSSEIAKMG